MCMRVYMRVYMANSHQDTTTSDTRRTHTTGHGTAPEKGGTRANIKQNLLSWGDLNGKNEKSKKKFVNKKKSSNFAKETTKQ